jgi:sec-independent protein translocase protein TatA
MLGGLSIWELLLVFLIFLLFFGAKRLPEIGKSLGEGIREFKDSVQEIGDDEERPEQLARGSGDAARGTGEETSDPKG